MRVAPGLVVLIRCKIALELKLMRVREIQRDLIHVTPSPVFPRFNGTNNRMLRGAKVLGRVFILRRITAAHVPAGQAQAQVDPTIA